MVYTINNPSLPHLIDEWKTGRYGERGYSERESYCPICGQPAVELYYNTGTNEVVGCKECTKSITTEM